VQQRDDHNIEIVGMEERADSYISTLSKGMRQRIGLAQALLHEPEVLILDEPTIGLDPAQVVGVRKLIQEIGKQRTVLLSTHILSEAQQMCDRVLIINKGRIVAEDSPENLQSHLGGAAKRLSVAVAGKASGFEKSIGKVEGVTQVVAEKEGRFIIDTSGDKDARPAIARAIIQGNYDLLELRPVGVSLEDIFIQLTREEEEMGAEMDEEGETAEMDEKEG
jgi:ABC-2 type transport system ATP-binding protein